MNGSIHLESVTVTLFTITLKHITADFTQQQFKMMIIGQAKNGLLLVFVSSAITKGRRVWFWPPFCSEPRTEYFHRTRPPVRCTGFTTSYVFSDELLRIRELKRRLLFSLVAARSSSLACKHTCAAQVRLYPLPPISPARFSEETSIGHALRTIFWNVSAAWSFQLFFSALAKVDVVLARYISVGCWPVKRDHRYEKQPDPNTLFNTFRRIGSFSILRKYLLNDKNLVVICK